jgi:hypothetical protein
LPDTIAGMTKTTKSKPRKPRRKKPRKGEMVFRDEPVWEPLLGLARIYIDEFMWMYEVQLENGKRLQGYKHWWTRRYLHLDEDGEPWFWTGKAEMYEPYVGDIVDLFNEVTRWHYPGQHAEELEEWRDEQREAEERGEPVDSGIPGYTPPNGESDGFDA